MNQLLQNPGIRETYDYLSTKYGKDCADRYLVIMASRAKGGPGTPRGRRRYIKKEG